MSATFNRNAVVHVYVPMRATVDDGWDPIEENTNVFVAFVERDETLDPDVDFVEAEWAEGLHPRRWFARILVGAGGDVELEPGIYDTYLKFDDTPEVPVFEAPGFVRVT